MSYTIHTLFAMALVVGCGGTSDESTGRARLALEMRGTSSTEAEESADPKEDVIFSKVVVWIDSVSVHSSGAGWVDITTDPFTLELFGPSSKPIALHATTIPPGQITQLRLTTPTDHAGYVVAKDGSVHPLVVPSSDATGIKIDGPWHVGACKTLLLRLDFDAAASIHLHAGDDGVKWIMSPVVDVSGEDHGDIVGCQLVEAAPRPGLGG